MQNKINKLLENISNIEKENNELIKLKGENFNLFNLLDRRTDEVKTHSRFIAELLNPKGSHNQGTLFLELFLKSIKTVLSKRNIQFNQLSNTRVEIEKYIGSINKNKDKGGRLDIVISNSDFTICIENKIYAENQPYQLERYHNYLKNKKSKLLIYLTLTGYEYELVTNEKKEEKTKLINNEDYICLSYTNHILNWIEKCYEKTSNQPILGESLKQYIVLIKGLTNQLPNNMEKEIKSQILKNISAAEKIKLQFDEAINEVSNSLKKDLKVRLEQECNIKYDEIILTNDGKFSSVFILREGKSGIGIESFNGNGHYNGCLFIGEFDFSKNEFKNGYVNNVWKRGTINTIWDKETLFNKYQNYEFGNKNEVINELVLIIRNYIDYNYE